MIDDLAELHDGVVQLLDGVTGVRRHLALLQHQYFALDPNLLGVDDLGPEVSVPEILAAVHGGLMSIDEALRVVTDVVYDTMRHTSRLKGPDLKILECQRAQADFKLAGITPAARREAAKLAVELDRQDDKEPEPWVLAVAEGRLPA